MDTQHILSLSYGKDSIACLFALEELGWPLDRIVHAEVFATDDIPADLPEMVEFKAKADEIIKSRFGVQVEHTFATRNGEKLTYEKLFYHIPKRKPKTLERISGGGGITGWPYPRAPWCNGQLKRPVFDKIKRGRIAPRVPHAKGSMVQQPTQDCRTQTSFLLAPLRREPR